MKKYSVIKAKYSGTLLDGRRFKVGEVVVMFPRANFQSADAQGHKTFLNEYVRLPDLRNYPEFAEIREDIKSKYNIDPDTFSSFKKTMRK